MKAMDLPEDIYPVEIDWPRCFKELRQFDWTPYRVSLILGADAPTVYAWEKGKSRPGHAYGAALLTLHSRVCGAEYSKKLYSDSAART